MEEFFRLIEEFFRLIAGAAHLFHGSLSKVLSEREMMIFSFEKIYGQNLLWGIL